MAKADISPEAALSGKSSYPPPHDAKLAGRKSWPITRQFGLTQFGVNRVELPPGAWSSNRHWHRANDEAVIVISGELVLVTDQGEEVLRAGDCVCFKAGVPDAHHQTSILEGSTAGALLVYVGSNKRGVSHAPRCPYLG